MNRISERLYQAVQPIWEQTHRHPFVTGLGDGSLSPHTFSFYMKQDYLFLLEYAKLFAIASTKAVDLETSARFAKLQEATLNEEMALHRAYAERFGISAAELEGSQPSFVMHAYTSYMLKVAYQGTLAELVSAVLPCMWSYWEIGKRLAKADGALAHPLYGEWVRTYSSDEFGELAQWLIDLLDRLAADSSEADRARLEQHFLTTSKMEYLFWEMAYREELWPIR
ncbi:thiaminase II [Brevibacillus fulvus]|uniref:Aminopyrimidine aminohydrolase n=1 Tax=Brevibacillus fulvus TaxID=1125967 RepID=A0A938Y008_9BACL|nr:thiaminase II [Brevibacillus fulvus]MBM7589047.1 thiaminase/transcriptional activator TenA [Brevibacillus fulvus]